MDNCRVICENRAYTKKKLEDLGFTVLDSRSNFLFAGNPRIPGEQFYQGLKNRGILVRQFDGQRTRDFIRVTVGRKDQMDAFLSAVEQILNEK